jgi:hypothetical protein
MTLITCFAALCSDEMYVFSTSQKRVSVEFVGTDKVQEKLNNFNELTSASVSYMGVSSTGAPDELKSLVPSKYCLMDYHHPVHFTAFFLLQISHNVCSNWSRWFCYHLFLQGLIKAVLHVPDLRLLDLTGNLFSQWQVRIPTERFLLFQLLYL